MLRRRYTRAIMRFPRHPFSFGLAALGAFSAIALLAQAPAAPVARLSAVTTNLKGEPGSVRIDVLAWSTDGARNQLVDAWNLIPPAPGTTGRGTRGARGARGDDATEAGAAPTTSAAPTGRGTRGTRGARGAAPPENAGATSAPPRNTPEGALAAALQSATGVGYLWTSESVGYSLRFAYRLPLPDGDERIILATDRRLGEWDGSWQPISGTASDYPFSIIELRLNAKHEGVGKTSLTGKVAVDNPANLIALENYADLPVTLKDVKPRLGS